MIEGLINQEQITILNVYAYNDRASKYIKQTFMELQGRIGKSKIMVGDINTPFSIIDRTSRLNNNKHEDLNNTMNQLNLNDIYKTLPLNISRISFFLFFVFLGSGRICTKIDHILGQ